MDPAIYLLLTLGAAGCLAWHVVTLWNARRSASWPRVPGRVLRSEAEESGVSVGGHTGDELHWTEARPLLVARVRYEYEIGGRVYRSDRVRFGGAGLKEAPDAQAHAARYRTGEPVLVYYHPRDPYNAVLEPGADVRHYGWTLLSAVLVALGAALSSSLLALAG